MDVTISKKWKVVIAIVVVITAAPLYFASNPGMDKITKGLWEKADDAKTPETLYKCIVFYGATYREDKAIELAKEWLRHYGGDESEKDASKRWDTWDPPEHSTYPWNEATRRPDQHGEDYRKTPHKLTGRVLIYWANHLEDAHQLQQAVHIYQLITDDAYCTQWELEREPEVQKDAVSGNTRNGSGSRSF